MDTCMWIHDYMHVHTRQWACTFTAMYNTCKSMDKCMWIHSHMHVNTWPLAPGFMAGNSVVSMIPPSFDSAVSTTMLTLGLAKSTSPPSLYLAVAASPLNLT
jgi:hypothetical protein